MTIHTKEAIEEILPQLIREHGVTLTQDHRKVLKLLVEHFPQRPAELVIVHLAVREGVARDLLDSGQDISPVISERFARRLVQQTGITMEWALWAIKCWAMSLGSTTDTRRKRLQITPVSHHKRSLPPIRQPKQQYELKGHRRALTDICFSPNGRWVSTASIDRTIRIWDARGGSPMATFFGGHRDWIRSIDYRPDGMRLCSGGDDGAIRLWDMQKGRRMHRLLGHKGWIHCVVYSGDGALIASGGSDGIVCIWQVETMELVCKYGPFPSAITSLSFDPMGKWLAIGYSGGVELWSLQEECRIAKQVRKGERISVLALPDGEVLVGDGAGLEKLNPCNGVRSIIFKGHKGAVWDFQLDPESPSIVSFGEDQSVRVWDIRDGTPIWTFDLRRKINAIALSRGGTLAIAFSSPIASIWEMGRAE
jgi:WD40 repeat protein